MEEDKFGLKSLRALWNQSHHSDSDTTQHRPRIATSIPATQGNRLLGTVNQIQPSTVSRGGTDRNNTSRAQTLNTNQIRKNANQNNALLQSKGEVFENPVYQHPSSTSSQGRHTRNNPSRTTRRPPANSSNGQGCGNEPKGQNRSHPNAHGQNSRGDSGSRVHPNAHGQNSRGDSGSRGQNSRGDSGSRGQNSRGDSGPHVQRVTTPMTFYQLRALCDKDPNEILFSINNDNSGFKLVLQDREIRPDLMAYVLIAVGKAIHSRMRSNVNAMINMLTSSDNNFLINFTPYLASRQKFLISNKPFHLESLVSMSDFLYKFQLSLPSNASDTIIEVLPLLEKTCKICLSDNEVVRSTVLKKLEAMEEQNINFLKEYTPKEIKQASHNERLQHRNPPESFRSIPVLPTVDDIQRSDSFLRPNLVKGQYQDTDHYLDVQYRLLREDYVRPLREGIAEYLILKKLGKSLKHCKDVKIYPDVHIVKQDFVNGGLVHIASFNDGNFAKIKWEYSKRFLTGSLLCLSSDNFETMLFAIVAKRDPKELVKGLLLLKFEEITDEVLNISPLRSFVVVETSAYFEAYRHNLDALLDLNEDTLPMKPYIIEVEKNVQRPHYLREASTYDMRPLLLPLDDTHVTYRQDGDGEIVSTYDFPETISPAAKNVHILRNDQWPTASELNLDRSQYNAIKAAVTKEFAVIQGPPGTGKTYVGLRIAQLLLHNMKAWQTETDHSPILVVCYTNHALDQFLEGLMLFTRKIVRVGGRTTNEALSKFRLNNLKMVIEEKREVPLHIFKGIGRKRHELRELKSHIDNVRQAVEKSYAAVLTEKVLGSCISSIHLAFLKSRYSHFKDDGCILYDWLNIRVRVGDDKFVMNVQYEIPEDQYETAANVNRNHPFVDRNQVPQESEEQGDSEEEADIEFIEAQRDVNSEEFNDVSFEVAPQQQREVDILPQSETGWQVQGGKKKMKKYVTNSLNRSQAMSEREVNSIENIWNLTLQQRWRLYKFWLERFIAKKQREVYVLQLQLKKEYEELCEMRTEEDLYICQQAHVVGMTTTGAAKYRNIVQHLNPKIVIVEEAAEILESHIVTSLAPNTQHVILIGDHQQLKPSPAVYSLAVKFDLNVSLFERMVKNGMECHRLDIQHRMRPEIAALLVPHIYTDLQNHESVSHFENIQGVSKNVYFITHDQIESSESDSRSKANKHEADFLIKLCRYILLQGYEPYQITVLTTYTGQLFALKKLVAKNNLLQAVRFTVVDNYQGEENDIILISFVRSNEDGAIGFLEVSNRVCVALSRARKGLFCIGNFELLVEQSELWKNIVGVLNKNQSIGTSLQLTCQNHPGVSSVVATAKDFESVPEGGCTRSCEFRLKCGHVCSLMCHPYDKEHLKVQCHKSCNKTCDQGLHQCKKKCFEDCGDCKVLVDKKIAECGHVIKVACHAQHESFVCSHRCERYLACGDLCSNTCGVACAVKCKRFKSIVSPVCGHKVELECFNTGNVDSLIKACKEPCRVKLSCDHICKGSCSKCHQGRLHVRCNQKCKRILVCGHECKSTCSKSCPPCRRPCENRCVHSKCPKMCGEPCDKCTEPCEWSCLHMQCSRKCGELCNRPACDEPCPKLLPCSHECIGLCGEPCPKECRICDEEKVSEIFFGSEEEDGAKFITIEECGHIFELSGITQWMNQDIREKREIQMKACPRCKGVIRKNLRFGNIVKTCLADIEKVKRQTFGDELRNEHMQLDLLETLGSKSGDEKISRIVEPLIKTLSAPKIRSIQEITVMENIINISTSLADAVKLLDIISLFIAFSDKDMQKTFDQLVSYMKRNKAWLVSFMQDDYLTASEQQLEELTWEVHRMKLADKLLKFLHKRTELRSNQHYQNLSKCITTYAPFREADVAKFTTDYTAVVALSGGTILNISDLEKQTILKAMGLSKGHWYQCPNGHVYCITECGGAVQESQCYECGAGIGGRDHALRRDNRVATAMDGSQHPAWSDAMNMDNYRF